MLSLFFSVFLSLFLCAVDQSLFENSVAQQQSPQTSRLSQVLARRPPASAHPNTGPACADSPSSGGQQRLKNAINLGKAVGAKVSASCGETERCTAQVRRTHITPWFLSLLFICSLLSGQRPAEEKRTQPPRRHRSHGDQQERRCRLELHGPARTKYHQQVCKHVLKPLMQTFSVGDLSEFYLNDSRTKLLELTFVRKHILLRRKFLSACLWLR